MSRLVEPDILRAIYARGADGQGHQKEEAGYGKTPVDETRYTRTEMSALYRKRWHVELDFRSIKTLMKMEVLRCISLNKVRKHDLSHRCFENYEHIIDAFCRAWNKLTVETGRIASQCFRRRVVIKQSF